MIEENNNSLNDREDYLTTDHDKTQDAGNSNAAQFNADEQERFVNDRQNTEYNDTDDTDEGALASISRTQQPFTTQGDIGEVEENMGGTTNLSLDQLKQEGDPEGMDGE